MTKEDAIESYKRSVELCKVRLDIEKMRMDIGEIKELEFYIERDEMAIQALSQEPCTDAMNRQAVNTLVDELARAISDERCCISRGRSTATIMQDILDLPPVTQKSGKWIPVSERLPEESDECLCCDKDGYITIGGVSKWSKEWYFDDDEIDIDVVAWMPLPEPYKAEREENA